MQQLQRLTAEEHVLASLSTVHTDIQQCRLSVDCHLLLLLLLLASDAAHDVTASAASHQPTVGAYTTQRRHYSHRSETARCTIAVE